MKLALLSVLMLGIGACSPAEPQPKALIGQPLLTASHIIASDGVPLPLKSWLPKSAPRAVIVALHGFNDYSHAFDLPGSYLSEQGIAVYALDQRGFGEAPGIGVWAENGRLAMDAAQLVHALARIHPHAPIFLLGESMGGAAAVMASMEKDLPLKGVILSAPALWGDTLVYDLYNGVAWMVAHSFPDKRFTGSGLKILATDNIPLLHEMSRDPLVQKSARADTIYGLIELMQAARDHIAGMHKPVLLLYGSRDQVVPPEPVFSAAARISAPCEMVYFPRGYHMLLRDLSRQAVYNRIVEWIDAQMRGTYVPFRTQEGCAVYDAA